MGTPPAAHSTDPIYPTHLTYRTHLTYLTDLTSDGHHIELLMMQLHVRFDRHILPD